MDTRRYEDIMELAVKTDDLIKRLSESSLPSKALPSHSARCLRWMSGAMLCTFVGVALFGFRPDLHEQVFTPAFLIQAIFLAVASILSALSAFAFSVPGEGKPGRVGWMLSSILFWVLFLVVSIFTTGNFLSGVGLSCIRNIVVLGAIPGFALFMMIRAAAPLKIELTGVLGALAAAGLGALGTQFICKNYNPLHILLWHFVPVVFLGFLGALLGRLIYRNR